MNLQETAADVSRIALGKGWDKPDWDVNFVAKLAFAITELSEAVDFVHGIDGEPLEVELADTAIRLLATLYGIWPDTWSPSRIEDRTRRVTSLRFAPVEVLVWPVVRNLSCAIEAWRKNDPLFGEMDARIYVEKAVLEVFLIADSLGVDLMHIILTKSAKNALRPPLHGKRRSVG